MKWWIRNLVPAAVLAGAVLAMAAVTYSPAPHSSAHREPMGSIRYAYPAEGFLVVDVETDGVTDQTIELDELMAGYIERIVYSHDGNDAAWSLTLADHEGVTLYSDAASNAASDPCSYVVTCEDAAGNVFGGPPFAGGLSISIADADGGTGTAVSVRLYVREAWRR